VITWLLFIAVLLSLSFFLGFYMWLLNECRGTSMGGFLKGPTNTDPGDQGVREPQCQSPYMFSPFFHWNVLFISPNTFSFLPLFVLYLMFCFFTISFGPFPPFVGQFLVKTLWFCAIISSHDFYVCCALIYFNNIRGRVRFAPPF